MRKKNEQIKGLVGNMQLFFVTQYNSSLSSFVSNFRILTQVIAEKTLTEKKFTDRKTDRQTNIITEKAKTIYPLYTSYRGYKHLCIEQQVIYQHSWKHYNANFNIIGLKNKIYKPLFTFVYNACMPTLI